MSTWTEVEKTAKRHGFKSYQDYLESAHWYHLRQRKGVESCSACKRTTTLVVHHVYYRDLLDVTPEDLVVLCKECHDDFHQACRHFNVSYIGVTEAQIADAVSDFRKTPWYAKWKERISRRRERKRKIPHGFNRKTYAKHLIRRFKTVAHNPSRSVAEDFCKWLLETIK